MAGLRGMVKVTCLCDWLVGTESIMGLEHGSGTHLYLI